MSGVEEVHVSAFVQPGQPILVIPAHQWRTLVWLHAELAWKQEWHWHFGDDNFTGHAEIPEYLYE